MSAGIPLAPGLVQPFDLRYVRDDLHVIANFRGHSEYEAVEAMLRLDDPTRPVVRAILTRHDQSQIDHVNDRRLQEAARQVGRESVLVNIVTAIDLAAPLPRFDLSFTSYRGEKVVLAVTCATALDAGRGGISDPGRHSIHGSLPIMLRGTSALAAVESRVEIDGVSYPIPEKFRAGPHFAACDGYFTRSHHMAIFRAGRRTVTVIEKPERFVPGERWVHASPHGERIYTIDSARPTGDISVTSRTRDLLETIGGTVSAGTFRLRRVRIGSSSFPADNVSLGFDGPNAFSVSIDQWSDAVTGRVVSTGDQAVRLEPSTPAWATSRRVAVTWCQRDHDIDIVTRIAEPDPA